MSEKEIIDGMSIKELQDAINVKERKIATYKYGTKKEVEFNIKEVDSLEVRSNGNLFHVRVDDGCEGWEALVEIPMDVLGDWEGGDTEEFVEDHIINFMLENDYYPVGSGEIEEIHVEEICRYGRPFFKIYN